MFGWLKPAVCAAADLVKDAGKPFLFVVIQAKPQATIAAQAVAALSQHGRVAQAFISDRVAYAAAMTGENTAPEISTKGPAAQKIETLWSEIKACFNENNKSLKSAKKVSNG